MLTKCAECDKVVTHPSQARAACKPAVKNFYRIIYCQAGYRMGIAQYIKLASNCRVQSCKEESDVQHWTQCVCLLNSIENSENFFFFSFQKLPSYIG